MLHIIEKNTLPEKTDKTSNTCITRILGVKVKQINQFCIENICEVVKVRKKMPNRKSLSVAICLQLQHFLKLAVASSQESSSSAFDRASLSCLASSGGGT